MSDTVDNVLNSVEESEPADVVVEETPVEEEAPVEETPVVEEAVEEAPVEESPVEESPVAEPEPVSTQEVVQNVQKILSSTETNVTVDNSELENRVKVLEERLESLIEIFKVTGYRKIINFNNIHVVDVKYENINERYEACVDLLNSFITEINKIIKIDLIEKKSITFLKELEEHLQKVINITGSLGQWNKDYFN